MEQQTTQQTPKEKEILKQINGFKVHYKQNLSKDGEYIDFQIFINKDVQDLIKKVIINELSDTEYILGMFDTKGCRTAFKFKRYKVKSVIYREINYNSYKDFLFSKDLIDKRKLNLKIGNISVLEDVKQYFRDGLKAIIKSLISFDVEQEIKFKIKDNE